MFSNVIKLNSIHFTVLQNHNANYPLEVYRFLKENGSGFMQFIPIVERLAREPGDDGLELVDPHFDGKALVTKWSVGSAQYGRFSMQDFRYLGTQ